MINKSDVLSHVLDPLRLKGVFVSYWEVCSPWAIQGNQEPCALIHYMVEGDASICIEGQMPIELHAGDLAMFPRGDAHVIGDSPMSTPQHLESILPERDMEMFNIISFGGNKGLSGRMLCAGLHYEVGGVLPLYRLLPSLLVVKAEKIVTEPLLARTLEGLASEINEYNDGRNLILLRGFELVYLLAMRVALHNDGSLGRFSAALKNPGIGSTLIAMHEKYNFPWTLELLAEQAAMSRSAFTQTFKHVIGESPARYLTKQRLAEARQLLINTTLSQDTIAERVGYESKMGMHLAFRNHYGVAPGTFRKKYQVKNLDDCQDQPKCSAKLLTPKL